ncbi:unnamed protein product [Calicophoron daubneyi]|uniref:Zinc transporter ZIP13 n=1 Tax=Calicophoron daubneyi TaxID=300641 RepID=A0AAV2TH36_CALDB
MWSLNFMHATNTLLCIFSASAVGLSGIFPLLFVSLKGSKNASKKSSRTLNRWLSYATGSLLGEVFINLLPEAWASEGYASSCIRISALWLFVGLVFFFIIEKISSNESESKQVEGYLNLFLNIIDNFVHGMAIGGSYLVSCRFGVLTTICILVHEIPHEIGDFAILLRSGFTRREAAKGQLITATGSLLGASLTFALNDLTTGWSSGCILSFTGGGFLYIALVSLVPDLLRESSTRESVLHMSLVLLGLMTMCAFKFLD